jgi:hypothetical protein
MNKTKWSSWLMIIIFIGSFFSVSAMGETNNVYVDDIPESGGTLFVDNTTFLRINQSDTATVDNITIQGPGDEIIVLHIVVDGKLSLDNVITCDNISLGVTTTDNGTITGNNTIINTNNARSFSLKNYGVMDFLNFVRETYSGFTIIENYGVLTAKNIRFKDQDDGTFILNQGVINFDNPAFIANGALAIFEITNNGNMTFNNSNWDVNYGGEINLNSQNGELNVNYGGCDVSGWSHGQQSKVTITDGNSTWKKFWIGNRNGFIDYTNQEKVNMTNVTVKTDYSGETNFRNNNKLILENFTLIGTGFSYVNNTGDLKLIKGYFNSSGSINLENTGVLTSENWNVKTYGKNSSVRITNKNNFMFNIPFIKGTTIEELTSIGLEGKNFTQSAGGVTTVINSGSITTQNSLDDNSSHSNNNQETNDGSTDQFPLYFLLIPIILIILVILFMVMKKKKGQ